MRSAPHTLLLAPLLLLAACADAPPPPTPAGPQLAISLAALELAGVGDVVWDLEVLNASGAPVWQRRLTSTGYGDGAGSASYVGPCDADAAQNTVRVWVVGVYAARVTSPGAFAAGATTGAGAVSGTPLDFESPTTLAPLTRTVTCRRDADTPVAFDVALMRRAQQGFFDMAVNFNDTFCSAKFDCCDDTDGTPGCDAQGAEDLRLLFDAAGARGRTFVLAFACTAGLGDADTTLYMDPLDLDCTDPSGPFSPDLRLRPDTTAPGNQCTPGPDGLTPCAPRVTELSTLDADSVLFQFAVYRGDEALPSGGASARKRYWNVALGVKPAIGACRLRTRATAEDADDDGDRVVEGVIAAGAVYPYVRWDVDLGRCASEGLAFGATTPGAVHTAYTGTSDASTTFAYVWAPDRLPGPPCHPACATGFTCVSTNRCEDVDECATDNGGCGASLCLNRPGTFACACPPGTLDLQGDGKTCARFDALAAGAAHSCAIATDGGLYCWGANERGQLGDGTTATRPHPTRVGSASDWSAVALGDAHTCALRAGALFCWGAGDSGQLGRGTTADSLLPARVGSAATWTALTAGARHTCGLLAGTLACWGDNAHGQLGDGTLAPALAPATVDAPPSAAPWTALAAGARHTCAARDGAALCWGDNAHGQLGDGTTVPHPTPAAVDTLVGVTALAAGDAHTCALSAGTLACWGRNSAGQLGDGTLTGRAFPAAVDAATTWTAVAAGARHSCGLRGGVAFCWGDNAAGQLGDDTTATHTAPTAVALGLDWSRLAAGGAHTCGAREGRVFCWGDNASGQLGHGGLTGDAATPTRVDPGPGWTEAVTGAGFGCGLRGGHLFCWGRNDAGQLGDGTTLPHAAPAQVGAEDGWVGLTAGDAHACALAAGALYCWGDNAHGQLGDATTTDRAAPTRVGTASDWSQVEAGAAHTCGVRTGALFCWGHNGSGQLGDGSLVTRTSPGPVGAESGWTAVSAGAFATCGLRGGALSCWGRNSGGQLGDGTFVDRSLPTAVGTGLEWTAVSVGLGHACGVRAGALFCWGDNGDGQLGVGDLAARGAPARVGVEADWSAISAGGPHSCGLRGDALHCWGDNGRGEVGDGSGATQTLPVRVGSDSGWSVVSAGREAWTAAVEGGALFTWGSGDDGRLGHPERRSPTPIAASW